MMMDMKFITGPVCTVGIYMRQVIMIYTQMDETFLKEIQTRKSALRSKAWESQPAVIHLTNNLL